MCIVLLSNLIFFLLYLLYRCIAPTYSPADIRALDTNTALARDVHGASYLPGFVGLNNLNCTDYINVILHALSHVTPLRDYMLQDSFLPVAAQDATASYNLNMQFSEKYPILRAFADVTRKLWSRDNFKSVISPAEFAHVLSARSENKFAVGRRSEAAELLSWLLNELHK